MSLRAPHTSATHHQLLERRKAGDGAHAERRAADAADRAAPLVRQVGEHDAKVHRVAQFDLDRHDRLCAQATGVSGERAARLASTRTEQTRRGALHAVEHRRRNAAAQRSAHRRLTAGGAWSTASVSARES